MKVRDDGLMSEGNKMFVSDGIPEGLMPEGLMPEGLVPEGM